MKLSAFIVTLRQSIAVALRKDRDGGPGFGKGINSKV
jgi:hypothetical protein